MASGLTLVGLMVGLFIFQDISPIPNVSTVSIALAQVPTSGLQAEWLFDEGSGTTAADTSGNGNPGTLTNGPTWTSSGHAGAALSFDGVNDRVIASVPNLPAVTISMWVNAPRAGTVKRIFDRNGSNPIIRILSDGRPQFVGSSFLNSTTAITANVWQHIVVVGDASGHKIYVNGSLAGSDAMAYVVTQSEAVSIGGSLDYFPGAIDDVRLYDRALSASEVSDLYADSPSTPAPTTYALTVTSYTMFAQVFKETP